MRTLKYYIAFYLFLISFLSGFANVLDHRNLFAVQADIKKSTQSQTTINHSKDDTAFVQVYPVLEKGDVYIVINSPKGFTKFEANVYNVLGKKIVTVTDNHIPPSYFTSVYMSEFPNGVYIFKIKADNKTFLRKISWYRT